MGENFYIFLNDKGEDIIFVFNLFFDILEKGWEIIYVGLFCFIE